MQSFVAYNLFWEPLKISKLVGIEWIVNILWCWQKGLILSSAKHNVCVLPGIWFGVIFFNSCGIEKKHQMFLYSELLIFYLNQVSCLIPRFSRRYTAYLLFSGTYHVMLKKHWN